jgi:hypothetical protein
MGFFEDLKSKLGILPNKYADTSIGDLGRIRAKLQTKLHVIEENYSKTLKENADRLSILQSESQYPEAEECERVIKSANTSYLKNVEDIEKELKLIESALKVKEKQRDNA